jgi:heterotetrameric sarcosine oxidase gamma subunit
MLEARSALAAQLAAGGRDGADGTRRLRLGELRGWHLPQLGHFAGTAAALTVAVREVTGYELPVSPQDALLHGDDIAFRVAADQYWIVTPDAARVAALAAAVGAADGTVTPLSASRSRLVVEGQAARAVLGRLVTVDVDPGAFPVGRFAQTGIHHVGGLLYRAATQRYEFYALRTYAASTWEALADAALPFGYDTFVEGG